MNSGNCVWCGGGAQCHPHKRGMRHDGSGPIIRHAVGCHECGARGPLEDSERKAWQVWGRGFGRHVHPEEELNLRKLLSNSDDIHVRSIARALLNHVSLEDLDDSLEHLHELELSMSLSRDPRATE